MIQPIVFEQIMVSEGDDGNIAFYIRTADGRHRIHAAYAVGLTTIKALDAPIAHEIKLFFGI